MKRIYQKPEIKVEFVQHNLKLLQASCTPPNEIKDYDDWFGAPEFDMEDKSYQFGDRDVE